MVVLGGGAVSYERGTPVALVGVRKCLLEMGWDVRKVKEEATGQLQVL